jgi:hypothetical protein
MTRIKEYFIKLVGWREQRTNFTEMRFHADEQTERELAKERKDMAMQNMRNKGSENMQVPSEEEIRGPSESTTPDARK